METMVLVDVFENWVESQSKNTALSYKRVVPQFFELTLGYKDISEIKESDLDSLTALKVKAGYVKKLRDRGVKDHTVRNYLAIVSSFFTELDINDIYKLKRDILKSSVKKLKDDSKLTYAMEEIEYEQLYAWISNKQFADRYKDKAKKYALVLEVMHCTAIRIDCIFNSLKWDHIKFEADSIGEKHWVIHAHDKGNKINEKPISDYLYQKIYETMQLDDNDLVFGSLSKRGFTNLLAEFSDETGVKITPHSIKVGAVTRYYRLTRDIVATSRFADHEDIKTTLRYIRIDNIHANSGSYLMSSKHDLNDINDLTESQIREILTKRPDLAMGILIEAVRDGKAKNV